MLKENGPLLLACNHPNSFLDAVILDVLFEKPIWSLARGDVFKSKIIIKILTALKILPVYRVSEGVENLSANYGTFDECKKLFREKTIVLIFSEGKCINEWHLRPLKKGTARLAINSWEEGIPLKVLPLGINYSSFRRFGKNMIINFGDFMEKDSIPWDASEGTRIQLFNTQLQQQLSGLVYEIEKNNLPLQKELFESPPSLLQKILLFLPAVIGWLAHSPLYIPVKLFTLKKASHNDHYDSILVALLLITYPIYLLLLTSLAFLITGCLYAFLLLLILPFCAWSYTQLKEQLDKTKSG